MADDRFSLYRIPGGFIRDCHDSGCDIGDYDARHRFWTGTSEQLGELQSRAKHYAFGGLDAAPFWMAAAARALLRALDREIAERCRESEMLDNAR